MSRCEVCLTFFLAILTPLINGSKFDFDVRLVDGKTPHDGRVEARRGTNSWENTLCGFDWDLREATVICHMLNYSKATAAGNIKLKLWDPVTHQITFCSGYETEIDHCRKYYSTILCQGNGATVACGNLTTEEKAIKVRLVGTTINHVGQVEVQYNGTWGAVCGNHWHINDAHVVCRMLGYKGATQSFEDVTGDNTTKIILTDVECSGKEKSIAQCYHNGWLNARSSYSMKCTHRGLAGVVCETEKDPSIELAAMVEKHNTVNVIYNGSWASVCDKNTAKVACHMYGYPGTHFDEKLNRKMSKFRSGLWLRRKGCTGKELSFKNCSGPWTWSDTCWYDERIVLCDTALQPHITVSEGAQPCTAELTINTTINSEIEKNLIKFYSINVVDTRKETLTNHWIIESVASNFIIGDGKNYNGVYNAPLEPGVTYRIGVTAQTKGVRGEINSGKYNVVSLTPTNCLPKAAGHPSAAFKVKISPVVFLLTIILSLFC